jgi:hypothetical protein
MKQRHTFTYANLQLNIGMNNWKDVYLLAPTPVQCFPKPAGAGSSIGPMVQPNAFHTPGSRQIAKREKRFEQDVPGWL